MSDYTFMAVGVLLCLAACTSGPKADFFVSTAGNDSWSGKLDQAKSNGKDGPFATLGRARDAVRELKGKGGQRETSYTVMVMDGTHFLPETFVLTPQDSGDEKLPVIYTASPGAKPVISGGVRLSGFHVNAKGWWELEIPKVAQGKWRFSQLFVNGQRRSRPVLPKEGYYYIDGEVPPSPGVKEKGYDRFSFKKGDLHNEFAGLTDIEVLCYHQWSMSRLRIGIIDEKEQVVTFSGPTCNPSYWAGLKKGQRYRLDNAPDALGDPGQWYLDCRKGILTYIPIQGETPEAAEVIAPRLDRLVDFQGNPDKREWVSNVIFDGLTFAHSAWNCPEEGYSFAQAEAIMSAAIAARGARNCVIRNCAVSHVGIYAVELANGCKFNRIENCELTDLGAGGVKLGQMDRSEDEEMVASDNTVNNCLIARGGRMHPAAVGVWIGRSSNNTVSHNDIDDFFYTGVSVGWSWGYAPSSANHNVIEYNHISNIGHGILSDMGGIYCLGDSPGTVLRYNRIHDCESFDYGGWGLYTDEGSTGILLENNIVYRVKTGGFHQHYGKENIVRNNIFAFSRMGQIIRSREEEHISFRFTNNIVYWKESPLLGSNWNNDKFVMDSNLYWNAAGEEIKFGKFSLEEWRARGHDVNSVIADPMFVDPENGDFTLKPDSPAEKIGFKPIDSSGIGRLPVSAPQ
ncbi:MAG TPA: right-handed parallel beta-helix repeat-containing protein [Candidatus Brocadiia bacterium]|nr:right-handed parallel beta-helix repeat-containing protein [Candidatus Brocadiia bacterium]